MELVSCKKEYWEFVRLLRTDKRVIENFIIQKNISPDDQKVYMKVNSKYFRICIYNGKPVGYIGLIGEAKNEVTICVSPEYKKMGFGSFMLKEFISLQKKNIWSKVKLNNLPSSKLFINNGFKKFKKDKGLIYYIYEHNE